MFEAQLVRLQKQTARTNALAQFAVQIEGAIHVITDERQPS